MNEKAGARSSLGENILPFSFDTSIPCVFFIAIS
jgi:hypothetical protein